LGGFAASLGSAAQALGENVEKQRENQLPLYAIRAQAGAMKSQMANRQLAAKAYEDAKKGNFNPERLPALQATLTSYGAPELADSVGKMIETRQKDRALDTTAQQLLTTQMAEDRALLIERRKQGLISEEEYNNGLTNIFNRRQERPKPTVPGTAGADIAAPEVKAPTAPAAPTVFKPLDPLGDPKKDLAFDNLTPAQKDAINKTLINDGKLPFRDDKTFKESWEKNVNKLSPAGRAEFIELINTAGSSVNPIEVPARDKIPAAAKAPAPATPPAAKAVAPATAVPKEFVYKDNFELPHENPMTAKQLKDNATTQANAVKANANDENYYNAVKSISQPIQYKIAEEANNYIIDQFTKNPKDVEAVMDLVRKEGGLAAMVNQGLGVNFGLPANSPFSVAITVPLEAGLVAALTPNQRTIFDRLTQSAATSAYFNMKQRGINPETAGEGKFAKQMQQEIGTKQTAGALFLAANKNLANLRMAKEAADIFDKELPKVKNYYAPHSAIKSQSPEMFKLEHKYSVINNAHDNAFHGKQ